MLLSEAEELADGIVRQVTDTIARATAPLLARIDALETREPRDGRDGRDAKGLDGIDGKDGIDGLGFDNLDVVYDGERTITVRFMQGERIREFPIVIPIMLDRGVWKEAAYERGDAVSWGGSLWIAQEATVEKPDGGKGWRLAVKRGRDGKDAPK